MTAPDSPDQQEDYSSAYKRFVLIMLTIVYAFNFIDRQLLVILQEPIKAEMGLSDAQLGLLSGFSFALVYVIAGIPIAYWADRGNRRNIVSMALAIWSGMTALSGFAQNFGHLLLARVGVGLGEAGGSPPSHSMISDYFRPENRGTALSFYSSGIYVGILLGFLFGGAIAESFGWRTAFFVVGIPGVLFAVLLRLTIKEPPRGRWDDQQTAEHKAGLGEVLALLRSTPSFWYIAMATGFSAFVGYGNGNFMPSFLIRNHGMSLSEVGLILAIAVGVTGIIGTVAGGYLADRFGRVDKRWFLWIPALGLLASLPPYLLLLFSEQTSVVVGSLIVGNLVNTVYLGPSIAISHALVPPSMRATASALMFFVLNMIGLGMGPFFTGLNSDLLQPHFGEDNLRYAMLITLNAKLIAIYLYYQGARRLPKDLAMLKEKLGV
jgi:predicted MFS family arabinose efflux permease